MEFAFSSFSRAGHKLLDMKYCLKLKIDLTLHHKPCALSQSLIGKNRLSGNSYFYDYLILTALVEEG
ncbi:hypothetical protein D1BOALGB6SA_1851 [Olavius sp. associated proteobacterium Delta 1]|nr:hypothetical protein D1BOALGB6SA_1851 [Olavius sp. associated proteobacterium Delta 1]